ncbi:unnamed protein product [Angiostrongylus costaricensis]|uniref:Uncharacterized protein n=1 Tax=Angiostrongylus costaricensis TaxID=334426 RepID=A0A0R3PVD2_ANGCS|nr:unnamed protein product [Angiostrongylus costaricensis]
MWHNSETHSTQNGRALSFPSLDDGRGQGLLRRVASLQFIAKKFEPLDKEVRAFVKLRYKDIAKFIIWPECRFDSVPSNGMKMLLHDNPSQLRPTREPDPRTILNKAELEDHRSPYLPCTINSVTRSDSEDSSSAESVLEMTRL